MRNVVWDVETNGLLHQLDRIHSLCIKDLDTGELLSCTDEPRGRELGYEPISKGLQVLSEAEKIYGHNIIKFDIPAVRKVHPDWDFKGQVYDTLTISSFRFAHQKELDFAEMKRAEKRGKEMALPKHMIGRQGLEAWGHRLGVHKGEYKVWCRENGIKEPFAEWRPEMQSYCEQDLEVNEALILHLREAGIPAQASDIEHRLQWYLAQQERNGWPFDRDKAEKLHAELAAEKDEIANRLISEFGWWYEKAGTTVPKRTIQYKVSKTRDVPELIVEGAAYSRVKRVEFNPNSRLHIAKVLKENYGWKPSEFTPSGQPKLDEDILKGLKIGVSVDLLRFLTINKLIGQLSSGKKAWLRYATTDTEAAQALGVPTIHHEVWQNNCVTHRASHKKPNAAQVPAVEKGKDGPIPGFDGGYGVECRELWYVPSIINGEEWVQLGSDAAGLELRCLAHYMARWDDGAYGRAILEGDKSKGTDIHSLNRDALRQTSLPKKLAKYAPDLPTLSRDDSKTFIYAYLYGAGDGKLGSIVAPGAPVSAQRRIGKLLRKTFEEKIPALGKLQKQVKKYVKRGWLRMPDGRRTYIRHEHAALNSLLQAAGAIICKAWIVEYDKRLAEKYHGEWVPEVAGGGWDDVWAALGWIHDETQLAVMKKHAEEVAQILLSSMEHITSLFDWRLPLEADYDIGPNWAATH